MQFEEVLRNVQEAGVRVERRTASIVVVFPPEVPRYDLVVLTADILTSEKLPFKDNYAVRYEGPQVTLEIWSA